MLRLTGSLRNLRLIGSAAIAIGCASDSTQVCPAVACALPIAVRVQVVSAATGAAVDSVSMQSAGPATGGAACSGNVCFVGGSAGDYQLTITAPGYETAHLDVVVKAAPPQKCGCGGVITQERTVKLVPTGAAS